MKKDEMKKTFEFKIKDLSKINSFIKEFETMIDQVLFLEFLENGELLSKYVNGDLESVFRYNKIDLSDVIEYPEGGLDKRVGVALYNVKKIIGILSILEKEDDITMTLKCGPGKIEGLEDTYEVDHLEIKTKQFKKVSIPIVASSQVAYLKDSIIESLLLPELKDDNLTEDENESRYNVRFDLDISLIKKIKSIVKLDETIGEVKFSAKKGGSSILTIKFDDKYTIEHDQGLVIAEDLKCTFDTEFIKKINDEDYKIFLDEDKIVIMSDVSDILYAFTSSQEGNDG